MTTFLWRAGRATQRASTSEGAARHKPPDLPHQHTDRHRRQDLCSPTPLTEFRCEFSGAAGSEMHSLNLSVVHEGDIGAPLERKAEYLEANKATSATKVDFLPR